MPKLTGEEIDAMLDGILENLHADLAHENEQRKRLGAMVDALNDQHPTPEPEETDP
jgi:hypothetical protein